MKSISFLLLLLICQPLYATHADSPDYVFKNISKESVVHRAKTMLDKLKLNYWLIEDFQIKVATSAFSSDYVVNIGHNSKSEPTITINVSNLNLSKKFKDHIIFTLKLADLESITEQESLVSVPVASLLKLKNSLYRLGGVNYEVNMLSEVHKFNITLNSVLVMFQIYSLSDRPGFWT